MFVIFFFMVVSFLVMMREVEGVVLLSELVFFIFIDSFFLFNFIFVVFFIEINFIFIIIFSDMNLIFVFIIIFVFLVVENEDGIEIDYVIFWIIVDYIMICSFNFIVIVIFIILVFFDVNVIVIFSVIVS